MSSNLPQYLIEFCDAFEWMAERKSDSIHAIVTDPPYGLKEYTDNEKRKLRTGRGGIWRIPPAFDGCKRRPLPRFTVLDESDRTALKGFFKQFAEQAIRILVPGGHVLIATNPLLSHFVYLPMLKAGFEKRGEIIRLVQTLRGGDRPKNAHTEFAWVTVMPRSGWEPWGLFRKPCEGRVQDNLRKWKAGGLRRISIDQPFSDVIQSSPTRAEERAIAPHPSGGAVDTHGARDQWMCSFVYQIDSETEPSRERQPMTFTEVYLGQVKETDFRITCAEDLELAHRLCTKRELQSFEKIGSTEPAYRSMLELN